MSAVITEQLVAVAQAARLAGHGGKGAIYDQACQKLGMSKASLLKKIKGVAVTKTRKRRSDAGTSALTRDEAMLISATLMESTRRQGKRLYSIEDALRVLRANGWVRAEFIDNDTGEIRPLASSTITRALRSYGLHPDQLLAPAPVTELQSLHPNHVWQIDASLCVLYYLIPQKDPRLNGLRVMEHKEFYKNKPANVARVAADRVWSYEITDHASGWIYVEYVMGAESGENLCSVLINAMQERGGADMLHGVPQILNMDPGSAMTAMMTRNLCRSLNIQMLVHAPGSARATGQVENARNIIERKFEPGLKFQPVADLAELNALAKKWRAHYNATAIHRRHGKTRSNVWMTITSDQLIKAPSIEVCRELAVAEPEGRKVTPKLRVSFQGVEYDVSTVPNVIVGQKLMVTRNPWREDAAQIVATDTQGYEVFYIVPKVEKNELGFAVSAATIGEEFKRHADTPAQVAMKALEQLVTGAQSADEAKAVRKGKALPFDGKLDPYKHINGTDLPSFLPRHGKAHELIVPTMILPPLSHVAAAKKLKELLGDLWTAERFAWLAQRFPDGVQEEQIADIATELSSPVAATKTALRVVGGQS